MHLFGDQEDVAGRCWRSLVLCFWLKTTHQTCHTTLSLVCRSTRQRLAAAALSTPLVAYLALVSLCLSNRSWEDSRTKHASHKDSVEPVTAT